MATACGQEGRDIPAVTAVVIGSDTVWFRLGTPDERPPAGWTASHDGRTWHAPLRWLQSASVAESVAGPYPRLVSLGYTSQGFVLLNLGQAGGVIGLEGDRRQAGSLVQAWARELTTNPWSRGVPVVRVGVRPDPAEPTGTIEIGTLADAETALADERGGVLLLADPPGGREGERIRGLADDRAARWSVVVLGRTEDPRWRFTVDSAGAVDTDLLGEPVSRQPVPPADPPGDEDTKAAAATPVLGGAEPTGRRRRPLAGRPWTIAAFAGAACLLVAAILLVPPTITRTTADSARQPTRHPATKAAPTTSPSTKPTPTKPTPTTSPSTKPTPPKSPSAEPTPARQAPKRAVPKGLPAGGTGMIRNLATGLCVDSDSNPAMALNGKPSGGHAFSSACNGTPSQQWSESPLLSKDSPRGSDMYRLVDKQTGYCLDSNTKGDVYTLPCLNPDQYQMWQRVRPPASAGGGKVVAYRDEATNRCLSVSRTDHTLRTQPCPTTGTWPKGMLFQRRRP